MTGSILVLGLGEVGKPLLQVISDRYEAVGIDIESEEFAGDCEIMHICYPFEIDDFVGVSAAYIENFSPELTIVHSTVAPGTTRAIYEASGAPIVNSPVRGKHKRMKQELLLYTKFIGGIEDEWSQRAAAHFETLGMRTAVLSSPEATELAKLTETTYFALLIAWAQEVERYCDELSVDIDEVVTIYSEVKYLPSESFFPGIIGGHCLMPNIKTLKSLQDSKILDSIEDSNRRKSTRSVD